MSMVKKIIDLIFPVKALPKDKDVCADVISKYESIVRRDNCNITQCFVSMIVVWGLGAAFITQFFKVFNNLVYLCLSVPIIIYILGVVLFIICRLKHMPVLSKSYYFVYLLFIDITGISGFNMLVGVFDTNYDYMSCLILLLISVVGYCAVYWCFFLRFNSNIAKLSNTSYSIGITVTITAVGYIIIKNLSVNSKLSIAGLCGFLLAIAPAYKFVNYRQYDNIQRAKNGQPFK